MSNDPRADAIAALTAFLGEDQPELVSRILLESVQRDHVAALAAVIEIAGYALICAGTATGQDPATILQQIAHHVAANP